MPDQAVHTGNEVEVLLTTQELAKILRKSVRGIELDRMNGDSPPYCKFGRAVRYRLSDVNSWLKSRTYSSRADELSQNAA